MLQHIGAELRAGRVGTESSGVTEWAETVLCG